MKNGKVINTGYRTYLRLLKYATPYWLIFLLGALAMLVYALTDTGFAYLIKTLTDNFAGRRVRMAQNNVEKLFDYANEKAGELALKAK